MLVCLMLIKTYNTNFDGIIINITDKNGRPFKIEDKISSNCLSINENYRLLYRAKNKKIR